MVRALLDGLARLEGPERYLVLLAPDQTFSPPSGRFDPVVVGWEYGDISRSDWHRESKRMGAFLRGLAPDVYHVPDLYIPRGWDGPICVTVHDCYDLPLLGPVHLFGRRYGWRWNFRFRYRYLSTWRALRGAGAIVANSRATARRVAQIHPELAGKIEAVPWGVEEFWFGPPGDPAEAVRDVSRPILLHVGGIESRKNPEGVLGTFARLRRTHHPTATLLLVGMATGAAPAHGASPEIPGVRPLGFVSDETLRSLYHAADGLLFPSFEEGFGCPVVEALATGCPVVTSRGTATEEAAQGHARLVDPNDPDEILRAVLSCLEAPRPAPARDLRRYSDTAREYLAIYRRLAA